MQDIAGLDPALAQKATALAEQRYAFVDRGHPAMAALFGHGIQWMARDIANGVATTQRTPDNEDDHDHGPVDPLDVVHKEIKLPSLPQIVTELREVVNDPDSSADDVARVVSKDAAVSAFLLRLVNSAFYSFPSQVDTISRAVTVVGMGQLSTLALGVSVVDMFKDVPRSIMDVPTFWKHSIAVGIIAQRLAEISGNKAAERFFVCGLLHDLGRMALFSAKPKKAAQILHLAHTESIPLYAAEARVVGFDHARLGGMLLRKWNFPFSLTMGVLHHHLPEKSEKFIEPHVVHIADIIAKGLGMGTNARFYVPPMSEVAWNRLGLRPAHIHTLLNDLDVMLDEMFSILL